jgi:hypothetical protein
MQYRPGSVGSTPLLIARVGNSAPWDWLRGASTGLAQDGDVTSAYHESLAQHLLQAVRGIHTTVVLWGDQAWHGDVVDGDVLAVLIRCVSYLQAPGGAPATPSGLHDGANVSALVARTQVRRLVFHSQCYDCATGELHDVVRRELNGAEAANGLRGVLPATDARSLGLVKLAAAVGDCEAVITVVVPPPYDACTRDVHEYLRSADETVLSTNALKAVVLHCGSADPPHAEVRTTLEKVRLRASAPMANTPAARHLLGVLAQQKAKPTAAPGQAEWGRQRAAELNEELQALEGELVSTRAAFVAAKERVDQLEAALRGDKPGQRRRGGGRHVPLIADRAGLQRSVNVAMRRHVDALRNGYHEFEGKAAAMEKAQNRTQADARLRMCLQWRVEHSAWLLRLLGDWPAPLVEGELILPPAAAPYPMRAEAAESPAAKTSSSNERPSTTDYEAAASLGTGGGAATSATSGGRVHKDNDDDPEAVTVGTSARPEDPIVVMYRERLLSLEREMARMADVDLAACIDDYFTQELERAESELAVWMSRTRSAEEQRNVYERAVKRPAGNSAL